LPHLAPEFGFGVIGDMQIPVAKVLAGAPANRHSSLQAAQPGGRCSQGGVKIPTGGKGEEAQARERLVPINPSTDSSGKRVSRFGVIPKPTVKVRMKENGRDASAFARAVSFRMP
jgi:hypothetical protein